MYSIDVISVFWVASTFCTQITYKLCFMSTHTHTHTHTHTRPQTPSDDSGLASQQASVANSEGKVFEC